MRNDSLVSLTPLPNGVTVLTLEDPEHGNALTTTMLLDLHEALRGAQAKGARALVLTGRGPNFCLGASPDDLARFSQSPLEEVAEATAFLSDVVLEIHEASIPVVAAMSGQAAGAGFALSLACDLRIADHTTRFNFAFASRGVPPDAGMTWFLPRLVGPGRAAEFVLTQPIIRARRAQTEGLVTEIVAVGDAVDHAVRLATVLAKSSPHSLPAARALVRSAEHSTLKQQLGLERNAFLAGITERRRPPAVREVSHG